MTRFLIILWATLTCSCSYSTSPCPIVDSGVIQEDAADSDAAPPVEPGTLGSVWACIQIDHIVSGAELSGTYGPCPDRRCPWPGFSGPGHPEPLCSPRPVVDCITAIDQANNCETLAEATANCNPDACR